VGGGLRAGEAAGGGGEKTRGAGVEHRKARQRTGAKSVLAFHHLLPRCVRAARFTPLGAGVLGLRVRGRAGEGGSYAGSLTSEP
jgi:hypothetical protein